MYSIAIDMAVDLRSVDGPRLMAMANPKRRNTQQQLPPHWCPESEVRHTSQHLLSELRIRPGH
jgi:hypothetical protein